MFRALLLAALLSACASVPCRSGTADALRRWSDGDFSRHYSSAGDVLVCKCADYTVRLRAAKLDLR